MSGETINNFSKRIIFYPLLLLRIPNIIIVAITMWIFATSVVYSRFLSMDILPVLSMKDLYLLVFIVGCIAAGGYLLNDIVDLRTDQVNHKRAYINTGIERTIASIIYAVITISPIPFAYSLASEIDRVEYMPLYFMAVILLAAYNIYFKKMPMIGNVLVALLCIGVVWTFLLAEEPSLHNLRQSDEASYNFIRSISMFYYVFSFCANLCREIIKDVEDMPGDLSVGAYTLPICIGIRRSMFVVGTILLGLGGFLIWWVLSMTYSLALVISIASLIGAPLILLFYYSMKEEVAEYVPQLSIAFKLWMLLGLIFIYITAI